MDIYRVCWKRKTSPAEAIPTMGYVKAESEADAIRIMTENLDSSYNYEITATPANEHMITPTDITVNFTNTAEYHLFG